MLYMVDNCPRCGAMKITFNVKGVHYIQQQTQG